MYPDPRTFTTDLPFAVLWPHTVHHAPGFDRWTFLGLDGSVFYPTPDLAIAGANRIMFRATRCHPSTFGVLVVFMANQVIYAKARVPVDLDWWVQNEGLAWASKVCS